MDPPPYFSNQSMPTSTRRSILETRELILSNASIIRPRQKLDGPIELVVGKAKPSSPLARSHTFTGSVSHVSSHGNDGPESSSAATRVHSTTPEQERAVSRPNGKHYAALVSRGGGAQIQMLLLGEPQDTVEGALEWLLDHTESIITDTLFRHRVKVVAGCCIACDISLGGVKQ